MSAIAVADLAGVVYSAGKVFNGLATGRLDTESFLRSGSLEGINSRSDLALLEDLRDAAQLILDRYRRRSPVDAEFVRAVNGALTRSAALHPGRLRTADQQIGVQTRYGRHTPAAMDTAGLQQIVDVSVAEPDPVETALELFVGLARAQPFEDGNKRTALFAANGFLLASGAGRLLTIPVDDRDTWVADGFNELLARAYIHADSAGVKDYLRERGFVDLPVSS